MTTPADRPAGLPAGLSTRPLRFDDVGEVAGLAIAAELADLGEAVVEEADLVADWSRPSADLAATTVGVLADGRIVGYAELISSDRGDAAVHPDHRGLGIGTWLAHWMQQRARERGGSIVGMPVPQGSPGDRLLTALGYHVRWTSWVLQLPEGGRVPDRPAPEGYAVRAARPDEVTAAWTVTEDAFLEWSDRERQPLDDWLAGVTGRPGFEPWQLRVAVGPDDAVVGFAQLQVGGDADDTAYINKLATSREVRGRGLGQVLLADAFAVAREHGCTRSELSTDSRTGALGLYEKVGMVVTSTWVHRAVHL